MCIRDRLLICLLWPRLGWTAEPRMEPNEQERAQTLVLLHEPIVMLTAKYGNLDGAARVRLAHERVQRMEPSDLMTPVAVAKGSRHGQESREFLVNGKRILVLLEGDLDEFDELTPVSYTHLDVYKRQGHRQTARHDRHSGRRPRSAPDRTWRC